MRCSCAHILILQNVITKMSLQCSYAGEPGLYSTFQLSLCFVKSYVLLDPFFKCSFYADCDGREMSILVM